MLGKSHIKRAPPTGAGRDFNWMSPQHFTNIRFHQNPLTRTSPLCVNAKLINGHSLGAKKKNPNKLKIYFMEIIVPPYLESVHYRF